MIFRHLPKTRAKQQDPLEEALRKLPKPMPRGGLQQEIFQAILAEAHRNPEASSTRKWRLALPPVRYSLPFVGLAVAVTLAFVLLPSIPRYQPDDDQTHTGASIPTSAQTTGLDQELAAQKALEKQRLLHQVIPQSGNQYIGEGVEITIVDKNSILASKGIIASNMESDIDLYRLIQEIYLNGGQLVAINGIPVQKYTEIVTSGTLVKVQDRRVQSPYTIKVIGDRDLLSKKLQDAHSFLMQLKKDENMDIQVQPSSLVTIEHQ